MTRSSIIYGRSDQSAPAGAKLAHTCTVPRVGGAVFSSADISHSQGIIHRDAHTPGRRSPDSQSMCFCLLAALSPRALILCAISDDTQQLGECCSVSDAAATVGSGRRVPHWSKGYPRGTLTHVTSQPPALTPAGYIPGRGEAGGTATAHSRLGIVICVDDRAVRFRIPQAHLLRRGVLAINEACTSACRSARPT